MPIWNEAMNKIDYLKLTGSMQQLAYAREVTIHEGRANGLRAIEVKNGDIRFTAMVDKCLDISELEYKGMTISFLSKPGLNGRNQFDTQGEEAIRSIMGGLFFTCGLQNICGPCVTDNVEYPMHGRIRTTPAEKLCHDAYWDGENYVVEIRGEMRESHLFGSNLVLRRAIRSVFGTNRIVITDEVENQTSESADLMLMYHCNFGFPFLTPGARLIIPEVSVCGREDWSQVHCSMFERVSEPIDGQQEFVFIHELAEKENGKSFAAIVNDELGIGVRLDFDRKAQPYFMEWMSMKTGDYVVGLEPSNSSVYGRKYHEEKGNLHKLAPFSKETYTLSFTILNSVEEISATEAECKALLG